MIHAKLFNQTLEIQKNLKGKILTTETSITFEIYTQDHENTYIIFEEKYSFKMEYKKSNLKGKDKKIWFFVCPKTGKLCRFIYNNFETRHQRGLYESQKRNKSNSFYALLDAEFYKEKYIEKKTSNPNRKRFYKGRFTRWFASLARKYPSVLDTFPRGIHEKPIFIIKASKFSKLINQRKKIKGFFFHIQLVRLRRVRTKVTFWLNAIDHENVVISLSCKPKKKKTFEMTYTYTHKGGKVWHFLNKEGKRRQFVYFLNYKIYAKS